jgi:DNA-binding MarR family transcriptional regulator
MIDQPRHAELIDRIRAGHERLMQRMSVVHAEDFVAIGISMPQAKALYLVVSAGAIHMSDLAARLRVTLSTVSGLVDRLVEGGLASRHDDPADRRQVVVTPTPAGARLIERFRELNERDLLSLLELLSDEELTTVAAALEALDRALARRGESAAVAGETVRPTPGTAAEVAS